MTHWVVLISTLVGCVGVIVRSALQYIVVIWSLKANKDKEERQHAIELLKALQKDRLTLLDRSRGSPREVPQLRDASSHDDDRV